MSMSCPVMLLIHLAYRLCLYQFELFQTHYSTDLPFIHPPTFLKPLRQASSHGLNPFTVEQPTSVHPPASTEFLLAFLALTARFHSKLIAYHSPHSASRPSNPMVASEFYASAASTQVRTINGARFGTYDLETTQAMLMLAMHEWGMDRGAQAWVYLGLAIRSTQAMGLHYEQDLDDSPFARCVPIQTTGRLSIADSGRGSVNAASHSNDAFIQAEIRRRTFWTCFILDRYLSNGKYRPQALAVGDMRIQLPASEQAFLFGDKVRTPMLGGDRADAPRADLVQSQRRASLVGEQLNGNSHRHSFASNGVNGAMDDEQGKWEIGPEEGLGSRYIKIVDIYGRVVKWACGGGRKYDESSS